VDIAWEILAPVQERWSAGDPRQIPSYEAGTWGPAEADVMIEGTGRRWRQP
jgi:glucose-6-phosphate 1-dehydrogenase